MRNPIVLLAPKTKDYHINLEHLIMLQDNAFKGTWLENPTHHLREFTHYCETFGP
jgi:hypothetical protein